MGKWRRKDLADRRRRKDETPEERRRPLPKDVEFLVVSENNKTLRLKIRNEITEQNCFIFRDQIQPVLVDHPQQYFIFELAEVPYVDSTAMSMLVDLHLFLKRHNKELYFRKPNEQFLRLVDQLLLEKVLNVIE